jgi:hypothetical protein
MGVKDGYEIRHNGVPSTFRDRKDTAYEAARFRPSGRHGNVPNNPYLSQLQVMRLGNLAGSA